MSDPRVDAGRSMRCKGVWPGAICSAALFVPAIFPFLRQGCQKYLTVGFVHGVVLA